MAKTLADKYANKAFGVVTMSAANALTFAQIQFGVGLFEGRALIIHRIQWFPTSASVREIVAATDALHMALTTSNRLADIEDVTDPSIITKRSIIGKAASIADVDLPIVQDFSMLPGGGWLCPANPLFLGADTGGFAAAAVVRAQLDFSFVELSAQDYLEVIQALFPANIA